MIRLTRRALLQGAALIAFARPAAAAAADGPELLTQTGLTLTTESGLALTIQ